MADCDNIEQCPVVKAVETRFIGKLAGVTEAYERTHETIKENTQQVQELNTAIQMQTKALEGVTDSLRTYRAENEGAHKTLTDIDSKLHNRITRTQLDLSDTAGKIRTEVSDKVGAVETSLAKSEGNLKGNLKAKVDWREMVKLTFIVTAVSAFFKYILPAIGG